MNTRINGIALFVTLLTATGSPVQAAPTSIPQVPGWSRTIPCTMDSEVRGLEHCVFETRGECEYYNNIFFSSSSLVTPCVLNDEGQWTFDVTE